MGTIIRYLAAFELHRPVVLLDPDIGPSALHSLVAEFRPAAVLSPSGAGLPDGYHLAEVDGPVWVREEEGPEPHPDLAVLLPTSGSTGSPKLVRLSRSAILANARAIATVLSIDDGELAPTSLPLHYSYGLSVLNSHLVTGAGVLVVPGGIMSRSFWDALDQHRATSLAGVPYHYEMLSRLRFEPVAHPSLTTLTQAGGKLAKARIEDFATRMRGAGGKLFVMYGQTEAAPRMATLPSERTLDKLGSVGPALPGGSFEIDGGEVVYHGPNVMMGYAMSLADLTRPDEMDGILRTGDLGHLDEDGFLYLTGRAKRIGKIFGERVSLDDVEQMLDLRGAVVSGDGRLVIWLERAEPATCRSVARALAGRLHKHTSGFDVRSVDSLPLLANGKVDYQALERGE